MRELAITRKSKVAKSLASTLADTEAPEVINNMFKQLNHQINVVFLGAPTDLLVEINERHREKLSLALIDCFLDYLNDNNLLPSRTKNKKLLC